MGDYFRLAPGAQDDLRLVAGLVHVLGDARLVHHPGFHPGGQLAAQATHQAQQGVVADKAGHFADQQVGQ
ncbi:hypothetical protein D3C80_1999860 [compost metagenome]